jgi:hypothetical protein
MFSHLFKLYYKHEKIFLHITYRNKIESVEYEIFLATFKTVGNSCCYATALTARIYVALTEHRAPDRTWEFYVLID